MNRKTLDFILVIITCFICIPVIYGQNSDKIEERIDVILSKMSLDEKIGQTALRGTSSRVKGSLPEGLKIAVREGRVGALLNVMNTEYVDELQRIAIEESPQGIPLIFSRDIIHGFKTIFPIPLGIAASWDAEVAKAVARTSAIEATSKGIRWTFAPMLDIATDSRWGRIAESPGEDPYLASVLAKGYVEGFQGSNASDPTSMAACAKHFLGYGAGIGGRDYNTAIIDDATLRNIYLPPFEAALEANALTVMTSFNELNGVPASGNKLILSDILRDEMGFEGFVVSDWNSVTEMIPHGYARDEKHAAELASNAGMDMEMTSTSYEDHMKELIDEGKLTIDQLEFYVKNILRVKFKLGLFQTPYREKNKDALYAPEHLESAKMAAIKSSVLLKNDGILPLKENIQIAMIGPLANKPREQLGTWTFDGDKNYSITPFVSFKQNQANVTFSEGLTYSRDKSENGFSEALEIAENADVIIFIAGEEAILSGEAHSRADISLPGAQEKLIKELSKTGKPIVLVIMAGRPITITSIIEEVDAVLSTWHPGTMAGPALFEMIFGIAEPGGRLPVTWPKTAGQLPLFYNHKSTGRPASEESFVQMDSIPIGAWQSSLGNNSHYLDVGFEPHFPFGFGLSYTTYDYSELKLSKNEIIFEEELEVRVSLTNTGERDGTETVQLYIQDVVGSITRPVRELKRFKKVFLSKGQTKEVIFKISSKDLKFTNNKNVLAAETGLFNLWVGPNSASGLKTEFRLINHN